MGVFVYWQDCLCDKLLYWLATNTAVNHKFGMGEWLFHAKLLQVLEHQVVAK